MRLNASNKYTILITYLFLHIFTSFAILHFLAPAQVPSNTTLNYVLFAMGCLLFLCLNIGALIEKPLLQGRSFRYGIHFWVASFITAVLALYFYNICMQITFNLNNNIHQPSGELNGIAYNINIACHAKQDKNLMLPAIQLNKHRWLVLCPPNLSALATLGYHTVIMDESLLLKTK